MPDPNRPKPRLAWYEDNRDYYEPAILYLRELFDVRVFQYTDEVVDEILKFDPDMLLLDCYMDHLSGIDLYRKISERKGKAILTVFLSLWANDESTQAEIQEIGVSGERIKYKDIKAASLARQLRDLYDGLHEEEHE